MAYILDADWIIQALKGHAQAASTLQRLSTEACYVSWVTVGEVYEVAYNGPNPSAYPDSLREFLALYRPVGLVEPTVEHFAAALALSIMS